jgi:tetratricopeptide (TPR) repeat protein
MITIRPLLFGLLLLSACSTQSVIDASHQYALRGDYRNAFAVLDEARQSQLSAGGTVDADLEAAHHEAWLNWLLFKARLHIFSEQEDKALADLATLLEAAPDFPEARALVDRAKYKKALRAAKEGEAHLQRKELELALAKFVQSDQTLPGFAPAKEGMLGVREALERLSKRAQEQFLEAVRKLPEFRFAEVWWHSTNTINNDPRREDALELRKQAQREIAQQYLALARECEQQDKYGAALLHYRAAQKNDSDIAGIADEIARMEREVQAGLLVEKSQKEMRRGTFDIALKLLDEAFEMSVMSRPKISEAMIETRRMVGESRYQATRDLEVLGKKSEALAGYEALAKDWPDGFSDEKARIEGLRYDVENAQKEWAEAEAAEAAGDMPKALEHYKNSERFYAGMKDGAARIERLQAAIRAAGGTSGGTSGG